MGEANKSYRIRTVPSAGVNTKLTVKLEQDYDFIDVLSLKLDQSNFYKTHSSNYGVVVGRVIANGGIGVPNAKLSVFIEATEETKDDILKNILYPYTSPSSKDQKNIRYNLLLSQLIDECHRAVGTFPPKRVVLDNDTVLEVFDQYFKFTTTTNNAGDYMMYGVPIYDNKIHCDIDLSQCGFLSQKPRDMFYKGYNVEQFESAEQFKFDTNLDNLTQIISNDTSLFVYPFWGDETEDEIAITRYDIDVQYKFENTCIFMGSVITDGENSTIFSTCNAHKMSGNMQFLTSKLGKIEMIRKTPNGSVENFKIKGDMLIDSNGVWCYQIPMNMDYITTDEYGNIIPSDNPNIGIATTTSARFRIILEGNSNSSSKRIGEILVPHNPSGTADYTFGNETAKEHFALLMYNNVYSIKSYIPRLQTAPAQRSRNFIGIKGVSNFGSQNPFPYNHFFAQGGAVFGIICNIAYLIIWVARTANRLMSELSCFACPIPIAWWSIDPCKPIRGMFFGIFEALEGCVGLGKGWCNQEDYAPYPSCECPGLLEVSKRNVRERYGEDTPVVTDWQIIWNCVIVSLGEDLNLWNFDFYNDWINGAVYLPTFNFNRFNKSRRKFLGLLGPKKTWEVLEFCGVKDNNGSLELAVTQSMLRKWFKLGMVKFRILNTCSLTFSSNMKWEAALDNKCTKDRDRNLCHLETGEVPIPYQPPVILYTDNDDVEHFYYRPILNIATKDYYIFPTDIILLGSMDKCNVDGILPLYKYLVSTTYQLPDAMRLSEFADEDINVDGGDNPDPPGVYTTFISSGITWGPNAGLYSGKGVQPPNNMPVNGISRTFYYESNYTGLFIGLACSGVTSNAKSCVNVERICEIGVDLDNSRTDYTCSESRGNDDAYYHIFDGLIFKDDVISGTEVRQIHASLNHNHFREYNSDGTKNYELINGIKKYKFTYLYPQSFDGKLASTYKQNARNHKSEQLNDTNYKNFRYGEENPPSIKSFYLKVTKDAFVFAKYKNSFYFYFGRVNGSSALDVLRNRFTADCIQNPEEGISIVVTVRQHTSVCFCSVTNISAPEFSVVVNDADTTYTLSIEDSDGKVIETAPANSTNFKKTITTTITELVFGVTKNQANIDYYSPEFEKGGRFTITVQSNSEVVKESFTIRMENFIRFDAMITKDIVGKMDDLICNSGCSDDCVCCGLDYALNKPSDSSLSDLKAIVNLYNFSNISSKGCKLSNYEMTINRRILAGSGLTIHIKPDSSGNIKNSSSYYTISKRGIGYKASNDYFESGFDGDTYIRITSVNGEGGVTGISFCRREFSMATNKYTYICNSSDSYGGGYLVERDVVYGGFTYDLETKVFNASNSPNFSSLANSYVNDNTEFELFNLYLCKGSYTIKLQNKKTGCEDDFYILDVEVVENPPIELKIYADVLKRALIASGFRKQGTYLPKDEAWWNEFYQFLTTANKPDWDTFSKWYVDPTTKSDTTDPTSITYPTEENFLEFYAEMQSCFLIECPQSVIRFDGIGYKPPYKTYLFGARRERSQNASVGVADLNAEQYTGDTHIWTYYGYGNDTYNQINYSPLPIDAEEVPVTKLDIPYASNSGGFAIPPVDPDEFLKLDSVKGITPDGMAKTVSVVPIPTSIINNYKVGGYYIGILGEGGLGVGYPAALGSLKDSIVRVPARNPELNEKPPTVYEVFAKLSTGDYVTNLKKYLFHFHLFNKEIKIMDEWMRVTAPKVNYVAPGACEAVNLGGYFGFFYLNGPKSQPAKIINSESDPDTLATEFAVGGDMADIKLTNIPRLGSCFDSLPIVRFAHSTANSNLKGIMTVGLQLNKKSSSETWALKCRVEVDLDFSLTVDNKNVSVVSYAKCTSTGVLQQVRSYYCYSLEINKDISETDLEDAASSLLGVGDYWVFDMKYNTNLTPVQMLYFENLTDNWENRLNYPFYTKPLDPYVELIPTKNDPGCASSGSLPATWNTYQDNKHGILSEIQSSYRRSILSNIATKCGNIKSTGSGASLTMPSNQMIYSIVHDNLSETRAFSQPLDFANYIKINDVKYKKKSDGSYTVDISAEMKGNNAFGCVGYTWKIEEGGYDTVIKSGSGASVSPGNGYELYNTRYSDGGSIKSVTLTYAGSFVSRPNVTIVGDGSGATVALLDRYVVTEDESEIERYEILGIVVTNRGSGYTYANVKFTQDPKVPLGHVYVVVNGSIRLYTLENFGLCTTDDECEMAYAYAEIVFPIDGNATWVRFDREKDYTYANISGSMLTAANLELNVRDVEKVVRISATDTTGVEFYTYTSLFKWIDPDERLTYCIYSCNPPLATKIGGVGVVIDLEMGDLYNIADILSGAAKAYVNKTNPSTTGQDIYNGKNIIRVGGGSGITEDYVGPLYIFNKATNTLLYTIPKAISSSCYMKYNVKI